MREKWSKMMSKLPYALAELLGHLEAAAIVLPAVRAPRFRTQHRIASGPRSNQAPNQPGPPGRAHHTSHGMRRGA